MDKDTFLSKIQEIGSCENQDERLSLLTKLGEDTSKVFDDMDSLNTTLTETKEKLSKSQETNMELFLKVNEQRSQADIQNGSTGIQEEPKKEYKSYKDLAKNYI